LPTKCFFLKFFYDSFLPNNTILKINQYFLNIKKLLFYTSSVEFKVFKNFSTSNLNIIFIKKQLNLIVIYIPPYLNLLFVSGIIIFSLNGRYHFRSTPFSSIHINICCCMPRNNERECCVLLTFGRIVKKKPHYSQGDGKLCQCLN